MQGIYMTFPHQLNFQKNKRMKILQGCINTEHQVHQETKMKIIFKDKTKTPCRAILAKDIYLITCMRTINQTNSR